jgi:hypothetical protein
VSQLFEEPCLNRQGFDPSGKMHYFFSLANPAFTGGPAGQAGIALAVRIQKILVTSKKILDDLRKIQVFCPFL